MTEAMSEERIEHIGILLSAPDVGGVAQVIARELLAELKRARAQLAEIGDEWSYETRNSWSGWQRCTTPMTEEYARKRAASSDRNRLVHRKAGEWRGVEQEADHG